LFKKILVYFYANSLNKIIIDKDYLILKKNLGQIKISKQEITSITKMGYSNLTMFYGSKGVFGFIGSTMDNAFSWVKDRNKMVKIITKRKNYILSADEPDKMVSDIKKCYNIV
jgi:hypothetical protein